MGPDFSKETIKTLGLRAGYICSHPKCHCLTTGPGAKNSSSIIGEAAHIRGARKAKNNRYDPSMSDEERSHIGNGIWLCVKHARMIDRDQERYTVAILDAWRTQHEANITEKMEDGSPVVFGTELIASGATSIEQTADLRLPDVVKYQNEIDKINKLIDGDELIKGKVLAENLISQIEDQVFPEKNQLHAKLLGLTGVAELRFGEPEKAAEAFLASAELRSKEDVKKLSHKALGLYLSGTKTEETLELIDRAIGMDPTDEHLKTIKANILLGLGRYEEVKKLLEDMVDAQSKLFFQSYLALHVENYQTAETSIREYLSKKPEDKEGLDILSTIIVTSSQHFLLTNAVSPNKIPQDIIDRLNEAERILQQLLAATVSDKKKAALLNKSSAIHSILGKKNTAFDDLTTAHSLDPSNPQILLNKANLFFLRGDSQEALVLFEKLPKELMSFKVNIAKVICLKETGRTQEAANLLLSFFNPKDPELEFFPHMRLVVETLFRGQKGLELEALIKTLEHDFKDNPYALWGRGVFEEEKGNDQMAVTLMKRAASLLPDFVDILISYSNLLTNKLKDHEHGVDLAKQIWEIIGEVRYLEREAQALYSLKRYEELGKLLEEAKALKIDSDVLLELEGLFSFQTKELERASECLLKLYLKRPDLPNTLLHYGDCMSRLCRFDEAIQQFERIKNKVQDPQALFYLSDFYLKQGRWADSLALAKRAKDLSGDEASKINFFYIFSRAEQIAGMGIDPVYVQAFRECMDAIPNFPLETREKYGLQLFSSDQINEILPLLDQRKKQVDDSLGLYNQRKLPVFALSQLLGSPSGIETYHRLLKNPAQQVFTEFGNEQEKEAASRLLPQSSHLALTSESLCLLAELDCLDLLSAHFEEVIVSQALVDDLHSLHTEERLLKEKRYLSAYGAGTVGAEEIQADTDFYEKLMAFVRDGCTIVGSPLHFPGNEANALEITGEANWSIVDWAKKKSVPVLVDDVVLAAVIKEFQCKDVVTTQGLLKFFSASGLIPLSRYHEALRNMLHLGVTYLRVDVDFAIRLLEKASFQSTDEVKLLFNLLGDMATTLVSSVVIVSALIRSLWWKEEFWKVFEEFLPLVVNERNRKEYCNTLLYALSKRLDPKNIIRNTVLSRTEELLRRFYPDF